MENCQLVMETGSFKILFRSSLGESMASYLLQNTIYRDAYTEIIFKSKYLGQRESAKNQNKLLHRMLLTSKFEKAF